jgi:hypothetical protein
MQTMTNDTTSMMAVWQMSGGVAAAHTALCASGDEVLSTSAISTNNSFSCLTGADEMLSASAVSNNSSTWGCTGGAEEVVMSAASGDEGLSAGAATMPGQMFCSPAPR